MERTFERPMSIATADDGDVCGFPTFSRALGRSRKCQRHPTLGVTESSRLGKDMHQPHRGFSLIECSVAVAAFAVVLSIALPSLTALYRTHQVRAAMLELGAHLALARSTSITRGDPVGMCPRKSSDACAAGHDWTQGWLLFADPDGNRRPDGARDIIASGTGKVDAKISVRTTSGRTHLRFSPLGTMSGTNVTFNVCQEGDLEGQVIVSMTGRLRSLRPRLPQPCPS
ncbi:GspH/FimT family pseudopilin [Xanthomonas euvesicatoria]|uniref:GspH/FimT family pseudopilin n=1 Tax=Xanthomonas euvesicatoria TaxID=456327 RepID=UPI0031F32EFD